MNIFIFLILYADCNMDTGPFGRFGSERKLGANFFCPLFHILDAISVVGILPIDIESLSIIAYLNDQSLACQAERRWGR